MENTAKGFLKVRVTRAGGTLPVEGAVVTISEYGGESGEGDGILYSLRTDRGGLTETVSLPAPALVDSTSPGNVQPFATYNVEVKYGGFYPVELVGVPVFAGIVAVQPVDLLPGGDADRIAGSVGNRVMIYETAQSEALKPGGVLREDIGNKNGGISGRAVSENGGEANE